MSAHINQKALVHAVASVSHALREKARYRMDCVLLQIRGRKATFIVTDGAQLLWRTIDLQNSPGDFEALIPPDIVCRILNIWTKHNNGTATIDRSGDSVSIGYVDGRGKSKEIRWSMPEGRFPDWQSIRKQWEQAEQTSWLERRASGLREFFAPVDSTRIRLNGDVIVGHSPEAISECEFGGKVDLCVCREKLYAWLDHCPDRSLARLSFHGSDSPIVGTCSGGPTIVLMPMEHRK